MTRYARKNMYLFLGVLTLRKVRVEWARPQILYPNLGGVLSAPPGQRVSIGYNLDTLPKFGVIWV